MRLAIVGDHWDSTDVQYKLPFVGQAGDELNRILGDAGIRRAEVSLITTVFNMYPPGGAVESLCCTKTSRDGIPGLPALVTGKYLRAEFQPQLDRLYGELAAARPNVVLALGDVASWALLHQRALKKIRGTAAISPVVKDLKVIPAYHPATILKAWDLRHVTVLDFQKAKREAEFPELRKRVRTFWLDPSLSDIERFYHEHWLAGARGSFDIETAAGQITCIGFAPTPDICLVIPFCDYRNNTGSYWNFLDEELRAWDWVAKFLSAPIPKVAQNGLYDIQYLWFIYGIPVLNFEHDTMLLHHSLQPESPKGLDFLGSVYTNEPAWKTHRPRGEHTIKRED